jgi:hypothetical protein
MRWACHVALSRREMYTGLCWGNLKDGDHLEDLGKVGRIIFKWIFQK